MPRIKIHYEPVPEGIWMLRCDNGAWCRAVDDPPGGECFLCCTSYADAGATAQHQKDVYDVVCTPERVK